MEPVRAFCPYNNDPPVLVFANGEIHGNTSGVGGGVSLKYSDAWFDKTDFYYNDAYAIVIAPGTNIPAISQCTFNNNTPQDFNF